MDGTLSPNYNLGALGRTSLDFPKYGQNVMSLTRDYTRTTVSFSFYPSDMAACANQTCPVVHVARVIEQYCFNSTPDLFNGQIANFILKPPKVIESRTYVKKANLECYWNNTVLLLWPHVQQGNSGANFLSWSKDTLLWLLQLKGGGGPDSLKRGPWAKSMNFTKYGQIVKTTTKNFNLTAAKKSVVSLLQNW